MALLCTALAASPAIAADLVGDPPAVPTLEHAQPYSAHTAATLLSGQLLLESAVWFQRRLSDSPWLAGSQDQVNLAPSAVRLGLPAGFELQAAFDGQARRTYRSKPFEGATDVVLTAKSQLLRDSQGGRVTALASLRVPSGGAAFRIPEARARFGILASTAADRRQMLHVNLLFEHRVKPTLGGHDEYYIGGTGDGGGGGGGTPEKFVLERMTSAFECRLSRKWAGLLALFAHRDPDLDDDMSIGGALGARWRDGRYLLAELTGGYGLFMTHTSSADREWFLAFGLGVLARPWGTSPS